MIMMMVRLMTLESQVVLYCRDCEMVKRLFLYVVLLLLLVHGSYEQQQHREVLIVGDSLVQVPSAMFNITKMLREELTKVRHDFDITVRMNALPSLKVAALYEFVENKLQAKIEWVNKTLLFKASDAAKKP